MSNRSPRSVSVDQFAVVTVTQSRQWFFDGAIPGLSLDEAKKAAATFNTLSGPDPAKVAFVVVSNPAIDLDINREEGGKE